MALHDNTETVQFARHVSNGVPSWLYLDGATRQMAPAVQAKTSTDVSAGNSRQGAVLDWKSSFVLFQKYAVIPQEAVKKGTIARSCVCSNSDEGAHTSHLQVLATVLFQEYRDFIAETGDVKALQAAAKARISWIANGMSCFMFKKLPPVALPASWEATVRR